MSYARPFDVPERDPNPEHIHEAECPDCGGRGYVIVAGCCGQYRGDGECCQEPIPEQAPCSHPTHRRF